MTLSIQKWGNSAAVRLPAALLEEVQLALGDKVNVNVRPEGIVLTPASRAYSLEELLAQCDSKAAMPEDLADWTNAKPVGRETW